MGDVKPWQIVVIVGAFLGAGVLLWLTLNRGPDIRIADAMLMVDVRTGELFEVSRKPRPPTIPAPNPGTKELTLLPVEKGEDGTWRVMGRYLDNVEALKPSTEVLVDRDTGEVRPTNTKPKRG